MDQKCTSKRSSNSRSSHSCCVIGCKNRYSNTGPEVKFYSFPRKKYEAGRMETWINSVRLFNPDKNVWEPSKFTFICSEHFVGNKKSNIMFDPSYNPTIFPPIYKGKHYSNARYLWRQERERKKKLAFRNAEIKNVLNEECNFPYRSNIFHCIQKPIEIKKEVLNGVSNIPYRINTLLPYTNGRKPSEFETVFINEDYGNYIPDKADTYIKTDKVNVSSQVSMKTEANEFYFGCVFYNNGVSTQISTPPRSTTLFSTNHKDHPYCKYSLGRKVPTM